MIDLQRCGI